MTPPLLSRRGLLRSLGAVGGTLSLAGCADSLPPMGRRVQLGKVDTPAASPPRYRNWVPAADDVADAEFRAADVLCSQPQQVTYVDGDDFAAFPRSVVECSIDWFGSGYDAYERVVKAGPAYALTGDVTPSTVAEALEPTGYERAGSYEGYQLYRRDDVSRTVGVRSGTVLYAANPLTGSDEDESPAFVRALADAGAGRIERKHAADPAFARLTDAVGDRPVTWLGPTGLDPTDQALTGAVSETVEGERAYRVHHLLYPEGIEPPVRDIERAIEADERTITADRAEVRADGRLAVVETVRAVTPLDEYGGPAWPQVTWGVERDGSTATIVHEAGEAADAAKTVALTTGPEGTQTATDAQFSDQFDTVDPGDRLSVDLDGATTLVLEYRQSEHRKGRLLTYSVP